VFAETKRSNLAKLLDHIEDEHGKSVADRVLVVMCRAASWWVKRRYPPDDGGDVLPMWTAVS
jgi:hypothetical protein